LIDFLFKKKAIKVRGIICHKRPAIFWLDLVAAVGSWRA
jgi:hypothetical protein